MKFILYVILFISISYAAIAADCSPGYVFQRNSGVGCVQENCNTIADAHYSYTGQCICGSSGSINENPDDPNKACRYPNSYTSCPGCVYLCVHSNEPCPDSVDATKTTGSTDIEPTGKPEDSPQIMDIEKEIERLSPKWDNVKKNLSRQAPTLNYLEFLLYLKKLEEANPDTDWKKLIAKLHAEEYPHDINRTTWLNVRLFQHGKETEGYDKVKEISMFVPKFVLGPDGKKIDIAHSYAGLRSDLNRGSVAGWFMRRINTHWGDTYQVIFNRDTAYAPPDQRAGNDVGLWLSSYYRNSDNKDKKLSEAYEDYFASLRE